MPRVVVVVVVHTEHALEQDIVVHSEAAAVEATRLEGRRREHPSEIPQHSLEGGLL
jgi:hypothetical protein